MKWTCIISVLLLLQINLKVSGQTYTVSGYITDEQSGETLIGAAVQEKGHPGGVITDMNGLFRFVGLSPGKHTLVISHLSYETKEIQVNIVNKSQVLNAIKLKSQPQKLSEVSIVAEKPNVAGDRQVETSMRELSAHAIQSIPTARNDIFTAIKFLPGVERTEPFSPLYSVRGGDPGGNAVMLDGVMIYNPYHASISSGIFNTRIIKSVDLLEGGFGAKYGGRNSSVMFITTKDGSTDALHGEIEPSTLHSRAFLEFPVGKKGSAMIAGRYYYDIVSQFIYQSNNYFYDMNFSYTLRLNARQRLSFKYFYSRDHSAIDFNTFYRYIGNTLNTDIYNDFDFSLFNRWYNQAATAIHTWVFGPRAFLRTQLYYSEHRSRNLSGIDFTYNAPSANQDTTRIRLQTSSVFNNFIGDLTLKSHINLKMARFNTLEIGIEANSYGFKNNVAINRIDQGSLNHYPIQLSAYGEDKIQMGPLILRPGVRITRYDGTPLYYEPRFNMVLSLPWEIQLRGAWGIYDQNVISMNTNDIEMSQIVDYYYPLKGYHPSQSIHYIAGIDKRLNSASVLSLDLYYKNISRVYTFDINEASSKILTLSDKLQAGKGTAYGAELMLRGAYKNLSGWFSYGLSWADRSYPFINNGKPYPYDYNRRNAVKIVGSYAITKNLEYNASFTYLSGNYRSIEQTVQSYYYYDPVTDQLSFFPQWIANGKNNAKMPALINLDMSIRKRLRKGFGARLSEVLGADESYLTVTIRNLTFFRRNVDYYFPISAIPRWKGKYVPFGTNYLPSVGMSYAIKF